MFSHLHDQIKAHAREEYPREACGLVIGGQYFPQKNISETPDQEFEMDPGLWGPHIQAVVHSHPDGPDFPSRKDMEQQIACAVPWGIVSVEQERVLEPFWFGDQVPIPPLVGRVFRHGVADCYAGVRHWYKLERDIWLPEFPRQDEWWFKGDNLLSQNCYRAGFKDTASSDLQKGDVVLFSVLCPGITNHSSVYVGNGLVFHHMFNRLSRHEPLGPWLKHATHFLRYAP